jgi:rfaE bifunctional protein nucleotidyltransferase chain/domain
MAEKKQNRKENRNIGRILFGNGSNPKERVFTDYASLKTVVKHIKGLDMKVVLTSGTFDMLHIGHARYFEEAKKHGDFLIVGVDSDKKVKDRKGPLRPVVPEAERVEMLTYTRSVDLVFLKPLEKIRWKLIKTVCPDTLIATKNTYDKTQLEELKKYSGEVVVLDPMATTSTSAKIRRMQIGFATRLEQVLVPKLMKAISDSMDEVKEE